MNYRQLEPSASQIFLTAYTPLTFSFIPLEKVTSTSGILYPTKIGTTC